MNMSPANLFGLLMLILFIIGAILVGNFAVATIFGVTVSELPTFLKFLSHVLGAFLIAIVLKKFFRV